MLLNIHTTRFTLLSMPLGQSRESQAETLEYDKKALLSQKVEVEEDTLLEDVQETIVLEQAPEIVQKAVETTIQKQLDDERWYLGEMLGGRTYAFGFRNAAHEKREKAQEADKRALLVRLLEISKGLVQEVLDPKRYVRIDAHAVAATVTPRDLNNHFVVKAQQYRVNENNQLEAIVNGFVYWREQVENVLDKRTLAERAFAQSPLFEDHPNPTGIPSRDQGSRKL